MGGYCWSHGFNPLGKEHNSKTYKNKKDVHSEMSMKSNCRRDERETCWQDSDCEEGWGQIVLQRTTR